MRHIAATRTGWAALTILLVGCSAWPVPDRELRAGDVESGPCELPDATSLPSGPEGAALLLSAISAVESCDAAEAQRAEAMMLDLVERLYDVGQLRPTLQLLAQEAVRRGAIPELSPEHAADYADQLTDMVGAELCAHGRAWDCEGRAHEPWEVVAARNLGLVRASLLTPEGPPAASHLLDPVFVTELEILSGVYFAEGSSVEPLADGPASFTLRDRLLADARSSIYLMTWAIYDDDTGRSTTDELVRRFREGLDVRIIVDEQVSYRAGHGRDNVARLEGAGVPVVRYRNPAGHYDGTHRKLLVVDGEVAIAGGMNIGDVYSHRGPPDAGRWRDTDVTVRGPAVADATLLFAEVWNEQTMVRPEYRELAPIEEPRAYPAPTGEARVAVTDHTPSDPRMTLATLKAIEGEMAVQVIDRGFAAALGEVFERDLQAARAIASASEVPAPRSAITVLTARYFFDQL